MVRILARTARSVQTGLEQAFRARACRATRATCAKYEMIRAYASTVGPMQYVLMNIPLSVNQRATANKALSIVSESFTVGPMQYALMNTPLSVNRRATANKDLSIVS